METVAVTMSSFLGDIQTVVTSIFSWVGTVCSTIVTNPLLLFTTGFLAVGGAIGIVGRLLSKN